MQLAIGSFQHGVENFCGSEWDKIEDDHAPAVSGAKQMSLTDIGSPEGIQTHSMP